MTTSDDAVRDDTETRRLALPDHPANAVASGPALDGPVHDPPRRGRPELRRPPEAPVRRLMLYLLIGLMGLADAFGFATTLTDINEGETLQWSVFTVALTIGAILGAHEVGRLVRARREGRDASTAWIVLLVAFWASLGGVIWWMRSAQPITDAGFVVSELVPTSPAGATGDINSIKVAFLLLGLYLLTGALAATTAYRFGNSHLLETWSAQRKRDRALRDRNNHWHRLELAERFRTHLTEERAAAQEAHHDHHEDVAAEAELHRRQVQLDMAARQGNPGATDDLTQR